MPRALSTAKTRSPEHCRDKACPEKRGTLETWPEPDTVPVRCETQAHSRAA